MAQENPLENREGNSGVAPRNSGRVVAQSNTIKIGYMYCDVIQFYYNQLKEYPDDSYVDFLWSHILRMYFTLDGGYGVEIPITTPPSTFSVRCIRQVPHFHLRKIWLVVDNRVEEEVNSSTWDQGIEQLGSV
ncbi:hypothetical protein GLAREA_09809 [Glarea lozoyensis ATCC 20868]|uniref:Uncharacterized protein n=1 Tax=Glarea lozoyensis (strain ATCC 20868 / MF5171) TaxID=1116229 RepID=S3DQD1_GLAL2|nr:uncharacterized protein GLAREA_09809 [Glarea lozoyensis ATCC 20868]EPE28688.1 hypothetical protein GLAREA_09809 [Glarea lozoyensis ATCC 20868]